MLFHPIVIFHYLELTKEALLSFAQCDHEDKHAVRHVEAVDPVVVRDGSVVLP